MKNEKKLFLIDAYALIYRSYFAFVKTPRINSKGLNTSAVFGFTNSLLEVIKKEKPIYEIITGATLACAALLLIIPGFLTDLIGFLLIIPVTRKFFILSISSKFKKKDIKNNENIIEGTIEENQENQIRKDD